MKLSHQVPEGFLFDSREDHLADGAVGVLYHGLSHVGQDLHFAFDTFKILEPLPVDLLLRTRAQALDEFDGHPRHVVSHLVGALVEKTPYESMANVVGVLAHFASFFVDRAPFERLQHLRRNPCEGFGAKPDGSDRSQSIDLGLEILDARFARVVLQRFEPRGDTIGRDDQQIVHAIAISVGMASAIRPWMSWKNPLRAAFTMRCSSPSPGNSTRKCRSRWQA